MKFWKKFKVVNNTSGHGFLLDEEVELLKKHGSSALFCRSLKRPEQEWWLTRKEVEEVK